MDIEKAIRDIHDGDADQLEFIFSDNDKIIVTAPAGCGKTTAMVSKIAWELCSGLIPNNKKVLAMTFSVNAAIRIKNSVKLLLPNLTENPKSLLRRIDIANYHNFAMRLLYKYGHLLSEDLANLSEFKILDDKAATNLLPEEEKNRFSELQEHLINIDYVSLHASIESYWMTLKNDLIPQKYITYNGILVGAIKLLQLDSFKKFYRNYYQMIIIDEFQDTNLLGYMLAECLISTNKAIFLGDDVQQIYGFLGAIDDALGRVSIKYNAKQISFKTNYRFKNNGRMMNTDLLVRWYAEYYNPCSTNAAILIKELESDIQEVEFISQGIKRIVDTNDSVAVLVRAGWQGNIIVNKLEKDNIPFFNALYSEQDTEYMNFYKIAIEEFHKCVSGKAVQRSLNKCLAAVKARESEVYTSSDKKYIFDSLYELMKTLFEISRTWEGNPKERYVDLDFCLGNNGLKHMMEYINEKVILTTIHSSKGLEWDYVIIPQMNACVFPSWNHVCKKCRSVQGFNINNNECVCTFAPEMAKKWKEELNAFYVSITRAKKDVFLTANIGPNQNGYRKQTNCMVNLPGLIKVNYDWDTYI